MPPDEVWAWLHGPFKAHNSPHVEHPENRQGDMFLWKQIRVATWLKIVVQQNLAATCGSSRISYFYFEVQQGKKGQEANRAEGSGEPGIR